MSTNLGTLSSRVDLSHQYGAAASQTTVSFTMFGLVFEAIHFFRSAETGYAVDSIELYIKHESAWYSDFVRFVDTANPCPASRRAMHLLAVAETTIPSDTSERFALLELA